MNKLSYGNFIWPNNPEKYEEVCIRQPVYYKWEDGTEEYIGMGPVQRIITGSGAFYGSNAYANFKTLLGMVGLEEAATLTHPVWGTRLGYLTEVKSKMEPVENYVAYTFEFREVDEFGKIPK